MTNNNPWAGLSSYEDPAKSKRQLKFCGRDNDIFDVTRLIDDNLLLILYGKSGIGKTSLLNAGVFPELRREQYLPISIRLGTLETGLTYQEAIITSIRKAIEEVHGTITTINVVEEQIDFQQPDYLWNFFARHRFVNGDQQPVFPVMVLDQFEETLRDTTHEHINKANTLLNQIQYLLDESHAINDCIVDGKEYYYDFNFRFVISIREDELYLLEDSIDYLSLSNFRNCRYRLRSLSVQGATEAILIPGESCIAEEQRQAIVDRIIALSKRPQSNEIDTLLVSLVCSGTFNKKAGESITLADLAMWKDNPMEVYYQDAIKGLTADQVRYIQQHFIREDGSRRRMDASEVRTVFGEATYNQLTQGANRLFSIGEKGQVELLHDQLGIAVYEDRKAFEERERKRKLRRRVSLISLIVLTIAGIFLLKNRQLKQQQWKMKEVQSMYVASKAMDLIETDSYLARLLALEILPKNINNPDRPYSTEAEQLLREACSRNSITLNHDTINSPSSTRSIFSPDGKYIVTSYSDGMIIVWDAETGSPVGRPLSAHTANIRSLAFSTDGKMLVSTSDDETIRIWDYDPNRTIGNPLKEHGSPLEGHTSWVSSASFSPDGRFIASSGADWTIRIWDTYTGEEIITPPLEGHLWGVNCVAYSPDGKHLASVSNDKTLRIWETENYECTHILQGHRGSVFNVTFSPDGTKLATASMDGTVRIWDANTFDCLDTLDGHLSWVWSVVFSPDSKRLVTTDGTAKVWDVENGTLICKPFDYSYTEYASFSPEGERIVATSSDPKTLVCDIEKSDKPQTTIEGIADPDEISFPITTMILTDDSKYIVVEHFDEIISWDLETGERLSQPVEGYIKSTSTDGKKILLYSREDNTSRIWDVETASFVGNTFNTDEIAMSPDGNMVVYTEIDSVFTMKVCEIKSGIELFSINSDEFDCLWYIDSYLFSPDSKYILSLPSFSSEVWKWDIAEKKEALHFEGEMHVDSFNPPFLTPDGKHVIAPNYSTSFTNDSTTVEIWNAETGVLDWIYASPRRCDISISPNSERLIISYSVDDVGVIEIIDLGNGSLIKQLETKTYSSYSFDSNGNILISDGSELILASTLTGEIIQNTKGNYDDIIHSTAYIVNSTTGEIMDFGGINNVRHINYSIAISPNERYYVCASEECVKVRNIESGKEVKCYKGDFDDVYSVSFTPNGRKIVATYDDGTIRIWDFPPLQELIDQTRERFKDRPLTPEERKMYYLE